MKMRKWLMAMVWVLALAACRKEKVESTGFGDVQTLTETLLMMKTPTTVRNWEVVDVKRKYISTSGTTDSLVKPAFSGQKMQFGINSTSGSKSYGILSGGSSGVSLLVPRVGVWQLSGTGTNQTLSFTSNPLFPGGGPGGVFTIQCYNSIRYDFRNGYGIDAQITRSLPGGRQLVESFALFGEAN